MKNEKITSVHRTKDGYLINDIVQIRNFTMDDEGINYDMDFNPKKITEEKAGELCNDFILQAIYNDLKKGQDS